MEGLDQYLEQLIKDKGLTGLDARVKEEMKGQMAKTLMDQIDRAAIDALSEEKAIELAEKMDDPNFTNEDAGKFIQEAGVDLQQVATAVMVQFRQFYLRGAPRNADGAMSGATSGEVASGEASDEAAQSEASSEAASDSGETAQGEVA